MGKHEFILPNELGWECNDEINAMVKEKLNLLADYMENGFITKDNINATTNVWIAELMDNMYAIIKRYQDG